MITGLLVIFEGIIELGTDVIVYDVMALPLLAGGDQDKVILWLPGVAVTTGAAGTAAGVTAFDIAAEDIPLEFFATIENV